jgi:hypothetical protein
MRRLKTVAARLFLLMVVPYFARGDDAIHCISELTIPQFRSTWMTFAPTSGSVSITISETGGVDNLKFASTDMVLNLTLESMFKINAKYLPACAGETITMFVDFVLEEGVETRPVAAVRYVAPDRLVIRFHPIRPIIDMRHREQ